MKAFATIACALLLSACSSIGQQVASGINNTQLKGMVGKAYTDVIYERPDFGKLVGRERVNEDREIMKHVGDFGSATSDIGGLYGKKESNARVIYFLVDSNGKVVDWATEFYRAGTASCWVGICSGTKNEQVPVEELDRIVKTSAGKSVEAWRARAL